MRVIVAPPPMMDLIDATFQVAGKPVIFAWGDKIYNPCGVKIGPELLAHEAVHRTQQLTGTHQFGGARAETAIRDWWYRYCADPQFRLEQEIPAHAAEFKKLLAMHGDASNNARIALSNVALKLAAPLYGKLITVAEAKKAILAAA